jgi:hypothetical protein
MLQLYKPTSPEKLQNYYRAMILRCLQEMSNDISKVNMFVEFRSDKTAKAVVNRAKSILAADSSFFSATSPHQRIKGPELHERLACYLIEQLFEQRPDSIVTVTQACNIFCKLPQQRNLGQLKRSMFREMMRDLVRDRFNLALRHDVPDSLNKHQQAWKGLALVEADTLAA